MSSDVVVDSMADAPLHYRVCGLCIQHSHMFASRIVYHSDGVVGGGVAALDGPLNGSVEALFDGNGPGVRRIVAVV